MFWSSGADLLRIVVIGPLAYLALVLILRVTGKRMLSKMNAFDLVVTIALGSVLATVLLSKSVVLAEGVLALAVLIGLQYVIAWAAVRSPRMNKVIKSEPTLLYYRGEFMQGALRREHVTEDAVRASMRSMGKGSLEEVRAVVLESDGSLSVLGSEATTEDLLRERSLAPHASEHG
jgi:uncharacterized membrane protein YcaP (DUF421 family)